MRDQTEPIEVTDYVHQLMKLNMETGPDTPRFSSDDLPFTDQDRAIDTDREVCDAMAKGYQCGLPDGHFGLHTAFAKPRRIACTFNEAAARLGEFSR